MRTLFLIPCLIFFITGCKTVRDAEVTSKIENKIKSTEEKHAEKKDSVLITGSVSVKSESDSYSYKIEYYFPTDSMTSLSKKSETWTVRQKNSVVDRQSTGSVISYMKEDSEFSYTGNSIADTSDKFHAASDNRPVQGADFLWIALGGGVLLIMIAGVVLLYFKIKKR
jgi:hypothetical protein